VLAARAIDGSHACRSPRVCAIGCCKRRAKWIRRPAVAQAAARLPFSVRGASDALTMVLIVPAIAATPRRRRASATASTRLVVGVVITATWTDRAVVVIGPFISSFSCSGESSMAMTIGPCRGRTIGRASASVLREATRVWAGRMT